MSGNTILPKHQSALVIPALKAPFEITKTFDVVQRPAPGQLLIKVHATALNPVDWKIQKHNIFNLVTTYPAVLGNDAAGEVVAVGEGVTGFAIGDRVIFQGWFSNELGTFQQYTQAIAEITAKIPANLSYDEAASIPVGFGTAALGFYFTSGLTPAWEASGKGKYANIPVLINGGSSSVGQYAIQLAKISGFSPIIATASLVHTDFLKSLGATHIIDRHLTFEQLSSSIQAITSLPVKHAFDAISEPETQQLVYNLIDNNGSMIVDLPKSPELKEDSTTGKIVHHVIGTVHIPGLHLGKQHARDVFTALTQFLAAGEIKPNRIRVLPGGLSGIIHGLKELEKGVSGMKLIVNPHA